MGYVADQFPSRLRLRLRLRPRDQQRFPV